MLSTLVTTKFSLLKMRTIKTKLLIRFQKKSELNYEVSETQIKLTKTLHTCAKRGKVSWQCALSTIGGTAGAGIATGLGVLSAPVTMGADLAAVLTIAGALAGAATCATSFCK